jgi:hypothetical protein
MRNTPNDHYWMFSSTVTVALTWALLIWILSQKAEARYLAPLPWVPDNCNTTGINNSHAKKKATIESLIKQFLSHDIFLPGYTGRGFLSSINERAVKDYIELKILWKTINDDSIEDFIKEKYIKTWDNSFLEERRWNTPKQDYKKTLLYISSQESTLPQLVEVLKHLPSISKESYDKDITALVKKCLEWEKNN